MTPEEIELAIERLHTAGFAWALTCCGRRREEAEDVLQTSYLKVLDGRARFAGQSSFKTFLFGVIRRTASEERRRDWLHGLLLGRWKKPDDGAIRGSGPEERLTLIAALARLPLRQRQVLELVFSLGLTVEEAAETLSISAGSARVHYSRGKKRLSRLIGEREQA